MAEIPAFENTPLEAIPAIANELRTTFRAHRTRPVEYRLLQLRKLYWGLKDNEDSIIEACKRDLGKPAYETHTSELGWCLNDIVFMSKNLEKWVKDEHPPDIQFTQKFVAPRIRKDPLGAVLVIGAYNFPFMLTLGPFAGAIAAGCTAVLKPSENAPSTAAVLQKIVAGCLDGSAYRVVNGGVPESTALLDEKWDKIFYTGNATIGAIIAKKAAETLTPVTLELGGRNPAIISKNADARLAARRMLWAKVYNAGQVCTSQNYILVDKEILQPLVSELKKAFAEFFPEGASASQDYGRIANERQFQKLKRMLDESRGRILLGGAMNAKERFLEPTVVQVDDISDPLIAEESFGPLIPILPVSDLDEAIRLANEVDETPLAIYPFGAKAETDKVLSQTRSGGASVNDGFFHASIPTLAFGGVGTSGQGAYRGRLSFDCFTHRRSVTTTPAWIEGMLDVRYPPYSEKKLKKLKGMSDLKPDFDRDGVVRRGLLGYVLALGAKGKTGGFFRWAFAAIVAVGVKQYLDRQGKV